MRTLCSKLDLKKTQKQKLQTTPTCSPGLPVRERLKKKFNIKRIILIMFLIRFSYRITNQLSFEAQMQVYSENKEKRSDRNRLRERWIDIFIKKT